jgi:hypothetical protein
VKGETKGLVCAVLFEKHLQNLSSVEYQSLIGSLQWLITLGHYNIATAVMSMSRFRVVPREGHLDQLKRMYRYVKKMKNSAIQVQTEGADFNKLSTKSHDWERLVYGNVIEL